MGRQRVCCLLREYLPAQRPKIFDFQREERQEGCAAERTSAVEVGVVCRPACHDLLVIHQAVTRLTQGAAGHQNLQPKTNAVRSERGQRAIHNGANRWQVRVTYLYGVTGRGLEAADVRGGIWSVRGSRGQRQSACTQEVFD